MSLKVIGAGFGRTGTMSTFTALNALGLRCYHMVEVLQNPANKGHLDFWLEVARGQPGAPHDWTRAFAGYEAAVDNPACCVWKELMQAYPDAKVLLTLHPRGPEAWYESTIDTIYFTENVWQWKVLEACTPFGRRFGEMSRRLIWGRSHAGTMDDRAAALAHYQRHVDEVRRTVPPERLLVYTVDQGWGPLCAFLGVPVPDMPFPNVNDRAQIKQLIAGMTRGAYGILAGGAALLGGLAYGMARLAG